MTIRLRYQRWGRWLAGEDMMNLWACLMQKANRYTVCSDKERVRVGFLCTRGVGFLMLPFIIHMHGL